MAGDLFVQRENPTRNKDLQPIGFAVNIGHGVCTINLLSRR